MEAVVDVAPAAAARVVRGEDGKERGVTAGLRRERQNRGRAAGERGAGAGQPVVAGGGVGLGEVDVGVDAAGRDEGAGGVEDPRP